MAIEARQRAKTPEALAEEIDVLAADLRRLHVALGTRSTEDALQAIKGLKERVKFTQTFESLAFFATRAATRLRLVAGMPAQDIRDALQTVRAEAEEVLK